MNLESILPHLTEFRGHLIYWADETHEWWAITQDELADLAAALQRGDHDAYSEWCTRTGRRVRFFATRGRETLLLEHPDEVPPGFVIEPLPGRPGPRGLMIE